MMKMVIFCCFWSQMNWKSELKRLSEDECLQHNKSFKSFTFYEAKQTVQIFFPSFSILQVDFVVSVVVIIYKVVMIILGWWKYNRGMNEKNGATFVTSLRQKIQTPWEVNKCPVITQYLNRVPTVK